MSFGPLFFLFDVEGMNGVKKVLNKEARGYKKCIYFYEEDGRLRANICIVELQIPKGAKVVYDRNPYGERRCSKAVVTAIFSDDKKELPEDTIAFSIDRAHVKIVWGNLLDCLRSFFPSISSIIEKLHEHIFSYMKYSTIVPDNKFDEDPRYVYSSGIHYFRTFNEAVEYKLLKNEIFGITGMVEGFKLNEKEKSYV